MLQEVVEFVLDCGATKYTITDAWLRAVQLPEFAEVLKVPRPSVSGSGQYYTVALCACTGCLTGHSVSIAVTLSLMRS